MTRIYDEAQIDVPSIGSGEEVYNFLLEKSRLGKEFIKCAGTADKVNLCVLASELGLLGYSSGELKSFFEYVFSKSEQST